MTGAEPTGLVRHDAARRALAEALTVDEVKQILGAAEARRAYAKIAKDRQMEADAVAYRLRAERRLGELMEAQRETVGLAPAGRPKEIGFESNPIIRPPTLAEAGIDKNLAHRARAAAAIPADEFEGHVAETVARISSIVEKAAPDVLKESERKAKRAAIYESTIIDGLTEQNLRELAESGQRFGVIYADPPWSFEVYSIKGKARSADRYYNTSSIEDICAIPVAPLAAEDCALFLWCVSPDLPGALRVIEAWGFAFKTVGFCWVKQNQQTDSLFTGMGYWTRANVELCLLATRGNPERLDKGVHQVVMSPVGAHSAKPEEVRRRIMRLVGGPYLELFARQPAPSWTVWGNEIAAAEREAAE